MGTSGRSDAEPATRDRLLAAAAELIREHGYAGTSLQMIADRLGFRKGAIYHHFRTRDEILAVFRVPPDKVLVFGDDHGQTTYRF